MRIAVLTGGGDAPGLNAAIRAVVRRALEGGHEVIGVRKGWLGLLDGDVVSLTRDSVSGILPRGGTILGTSRTNPFKDDEGGRRVLDTIRRLGMDAIIAIGGDDTLSVALKLHRMGVRVVGVPKTMDNDVPGTDYTIGFDTAVNVVMEACDRLHTTAEAHHRVMIIEVMGRDAGWVAGVGGLAGGADVILVPEVPFTIDEVCETIRRRHERGRTFSIVVVAEGAKPSDFGGQITQDARVDEFGHVRLGGVGALLAREVEARTGYETRVTVLGHLQRGGSPTVFDRVLATRLGVAAVEAVEAGRFGMMVAVQGTRIVTVNLEDALSGSKRLDLELYRLSRLFH
ncbi:MAG: ATP-dependent 6-phosphofructokinase [Armatimonadota bacterium]|nr:ATP-dependent 6-phosphofructokinase [Armatimonadota bacterium]